MKNEEIEYSDKKNEQKEIWLLLWEHAKIHIDADGYNIDFNDFFEYGKSKFKIELNDK